jgi:arginase family enzyme
MELNHLARRLLHMPGRGLTPREELAILHWQRARIIGADIPEMNPVRDINNVTAILAANLVREVASLVCCSVV